MRLQGKVALVTGSGSGIGKAIALAFAREGAVVMGGDRNPESAGRTAWEIADAGGSGGSLRADIGDPADCRALVERTLVDFGRIDILVNNAGVGFHRAFLDTTLEDWERVLRIDLTGAFVLSQHAVRHMVERGGGGRVINIGSISGQRGGTGRAAYGAAKAGLMQLTRVMAVELAPLGIAVNAIAPGPIVTAITNHGPEQTQAYLSRIPEGRYGVPESVAEAALFLASDACTFVHGETINVDGGFGAAGLIFSMKEMQSYRSGPRE